MENQSCVPYRGYAIDVRVVAGETASLNGKQRRYAISWMVLSVELSSTPIFSLPENLHFLTPDAGFAYAERQAKRFIDGCINDEREDVVP